MKERLQQEKERAHHEAAGYGLASG